MSRWQCHSCTSIRRDWIEHDRSSKRIRAVDRMNITKSMSSNNRIVMLNRKRRMAGNRTQNVAMHRWISLTTVLDAEGIWIVTLTVHDHTQSQPIPISKWRGREGGEVWVVFVWVGGDGRELVVVYLCLCRSRLFLCLWYCTWCVSLILTFQLIA